MAHFTPPSAPNCFALYMLQLHCTNLMKTRLNIVCTLFKGVVAFIAGRANRRHGIRSADRNIKWGSPSNIEYKWGYFTLQSSANQGTDSSLCNKSFPFRQPLLLGHCLILSAIEGRNKLVYIVEGKGKKKRKEKKVPRLECMISWWKMEYTWLIDDNELADRRMHTQGVMWE